MIALRRADLAPAQVGGVISAVADALIRRMIELAIESQGPPPAEFCWMSLGSHGRREPVPSSDVDSGMAWRDVPEWDPLSKATTQPGVHPRRPITCAESPPVSPTASGSSAGASTPTG